MKKIAYFFYPRLANDFPDVPAPGWDRDKLYKVKNNEKKKRNY